MARQLAGGEKNANHSQSESHHAQHFYHTDVTRKTRRGKEITQQKMADCAKILPRH